ncbi:MAG: SAM-dependent methyltransferase [Bryobacteraceae bacterium]
MAKQLAFRWQLLILAFGASSLWAVEPGKPSTTSLIVACHRAVLSKHTDPLLRNPDHLALKFLGPEERALLSNNTCSKALDMDAQSGMETLPGRGLTVLLRTRHIDSAFDESLRNGVQQVVILGAGLDSRAYRYRDRLSGIRLFEVDFPPTQEYKKKRVREIFGSLPRHVRYVPIDFTKQDLATVLAKAGYNPAKKTFFVWEGVTMYIPEEAVSATLQFVVRKSAPGSTIVFDYLPRSILSDENAKKALARLAAIGEPWIFGIPDDDREGLILRQGLRRVSDLSKEDLAARYLRKPDGTVYPVEGLPLRIAIGVVPGRERK